MRYFIGFLITIGLIILLIVLLFGGGGNKQKAPSAPRTLTSYANTDAETRLLIDGPINAQQTHDQIQISVGRDQTQFQHLKGYDGSVVTQQTFASSENAYNAFLHALVTANFANGISSPNSTAEQGQCPTGNRYIYEVVENGDVILRYWSTSCGNPKSYHGNNGLLLTLFEAQVPGYGDLTQNITL